MGRGSCLTPQRVRVCECECVFMVSLLNLSVTSFSGPGTAEGKDRSSAQNRSRTS